MQETGETMNKEDLYRVPYVVFESICDRHIRIIKRLWVLCILLVILLVGTNAMWIWYESQFMYYQEVEQDIDTGDGDTTVVGIGDNYGKGKTDR